MKYEYNGNLTYEERIALVSNEIMNNYSYISKGAAYIISSLEPPITTKVDDTIKFRRLSNIFYITKNNEIIAELLKLDRNIPSINNGINYILDYVLGKRNDLIYSDIFS